MAMSWNPTLSPGPQGATILSVAGTRENLTDETDSPANEPHIEDREELAGWLADQANNGASVLTYLKSSDRVIARVTDGIYRQPASALREVISNAWDADANEVTIVTDAPRFSRIIIRDDGIGMSHQTLSRLLHSIGGSAKRTAEGSKLGVTADGDLDRSPSGRLLIGKIGIGLFSVSQLSRRFRIITKVSGEPYRLIAEVRLRTYSEDPDDDLNRDSEDDFVSGEVRLTREPAEDLEAHGTDIVLDEIKPGARDQLRSADRWRALEEKRLAVDSGDNDEALSIRAIRPKYHAGWIPRLNAGDEPEIVEIPSELPWDSDTPSQDRMDSLVSAVESEFSRQNRPELSSTLDAYLETLWNLALSSPVEYVDSHPFDLTSKSKVRLFWLSNQLRGQAIELKLEGDQTVRNAVKAQAPGAPELLDGLKTTVGGFKVVVDGVELRRPVRFNFRPADARGLQSPLLFVGKYEPSLDRVSQENRGGSLALEAYLFWNGRVVPKENIGVLVRIRGSSGAAFDDSFFKYQVNEQTRLRQITAEIYVQRGLDAALNIDRESFNYAHPHFQLVSLWLHRAVRQLTNRHKSLSAALREERRKEESAAAENDIDTTADRVWSEQRGSEDPPSVEVVENDQEAERVRETGSVALTRSKIEYLNSGTSDEKSGKDTFARAVYKVLAAYDLISDRTYEQQQDIVAAILSIFAGPAEK
jgi:Histidine kinase-, DNA gyrase B-, and HSP90-like ATPase